MAAFTKTITNAVNLFGGGPSTKWGQAVPIYTMTWGVSKWGESSNNLIVNAVKALANSVVLDNSLSKEPSKLIENSQAVGSDLSSEQLFTGIWKVVFVSDTTEGENRDFASWTASSASSQSFTCVAAGTTIWS